MKRILLLVVVIALNMAAFWWLRNMALGFAIVSTSSNHFVGTGTLQNIYLHGIVAGMCMAVTLFLIARLMNEVDDKWHPWEKIKAWDKRIRSVE